MCEECVCFMTCPAGVSHVISQRHIPTSFLHPLTPALPYFTHPSFSPSLAGVCDGAVAADPGRGEYHRVGHQHAFGPERRVARQHRRRGECVVCVLCVLCVLVCTKFMFGRYLHEGCCCFSPFLIMLCVHPLADLTPALIPHV